jgi:hypothetical protein
MKGNTQYLKFLIVAFAVSVAFTLVAGVTAQEESWQIVRAEYGFKGRGTDVTDLLRDLIARGGVDGRVAVNNQTMGGDPAVGKDKILHVLARNKRNEEREFEFREGSFIDVGLFTVRRDDWDDRGRSDRDRGDPRSLFIIRGYYGAQGRTANVTDLLRSMVRDGALSLNVNNGNLGGDPATGADKVLIVIYRYRGEEQATAVREGNRLTIP